MPMSQKETYPEIITFEQNGEWIDPVDVNGARVRLRATLCRLGVPLERDGKIYTYAVVKAALDSKEFRDRLKNKAVFGHYRNETKERNSLLTVAIVVTGLSMRDSCLRAIVETLNTALGKNLLDDLVANKKFQLSLSGMGAVAYNDTMGGGEVAPGFEITGIDIVRLDEEDTQ